MPLITCPDCEKQISSAALSCIHCGRPMAKQEMPASQPAPSTRPPQRPALACPRCHSTDVKKLSAVWREGVSNLNATTTGVGLSGGGFGVGAAATSGTSRTLTATGAAPPPEKSNNGPGCLLSLGGSFAFVFLVFGVWSMVLLFGLIFVAGAAWRTLNDTYNQGPYLDQMREWEKQFRCSRCETVFKATL